MGPSVRGFVVLAALAASLGSAPGLALPQRAIRVEGGLVAVQGGVMEDPEAPRLPFGKLKHPTLYFVGVTNETPAGFWAEVELHLPQKKPRKAGFSVDAGKVYIWYWRGFDVIWDQPIPLRIAVYTDKSRKQKLGEQTMTFYYEGEDRRFLYSPLPQGEQGMPVLSGWREMRASHCKAAGSLTAGILLRDICHELWKYESLEHPDCEHPITGVEPLQPADSILLAGQPEAFQSRAEAFLAKGDLLLETWKVKSCDTVTPYEVMMIKAPQGGTDFFVAPALAKPPGGDV